jgi:hypothetical protein
LDRCPTKALATLGICQAADRAIVNLPYALTNLANWNAALMNKCLKGHRYVADNLFTSPSVEQLLPRIRKIIETCHRTPRTFS